jgi:hypothetical protein
MHLRCKRCVELFYVNDVMDLTRIVVSAFAGFTNWKKELKGALS